MAFSFNDCMTLGEEVEVELIDEHEDIKLINDDIKERVEHDFDKLSGNEVFIDDVTAEIFQKEEAIPTCLYCKKSINCVQDKNHKCFDNQSCLIVDNDGMLSVFQNADEVEKNIEYNQGFEFDQAQLLKLIHLVKLRPQLYDTTLDLVERSPVKRASLWTEIHREFGGTASISALNAKWKRLKDRYYKNLKFLDKYNGKKKINWPLQSSLNFLEPILQKKLITEKKASLQRKLVTVKPTLYNGTPTAMNNFSTASDKTRTSLPIRSTSSTTSISKSPFLSSPTSTTVKTVSFPFTLCPVSCSGAPATSSSTTVPIAKVNLSSLENNSSTSSAMAINSPSPDFLSDPTCSKCRNCSMRDLDESWNSLKNRLSMESSQDQKQPDSEEALGTYLTTVLRKLPNDKNQMLQVKVLKAISEVFLPSTKDHSYL